MEVSKLGAGAKGMCRAGSEGKGGTSQGIGEVVLAKDRPIY